MHRKSLSSSLYWGVLVVLVAVWGITPAPVSAVPTRTPTATDTQIAGQIDPARFCLGSNTDKLACGKILDELRTQYGIEILVRRVNVDPAAEGYAFADFGLEWSLERASALQHQVRQVAAYFGGETRFRQAFGMISNSSVETGYRLAVVLVSNRVGPGRSHWDDTNKRVHLTNGFWLHPAMVVHELGHAWADLNHLEDAFLSAVDGSYTSEGKYVWNAAYGRPVTPYGETSHREDLAEAFRVVVTTPDISKTSVRSAFIESNARPAK